MYPIMSKSKLDIEIQLKNSKNKIFVHSQKLISPSKNSIFININEILKKSKLGEISSFSVIARTKNNKVPTRINHQLIYGDIKNNSLNSSINVSLTNNNDFVQRIKTVLNGASFY